MSIVSIKKLNSRLMLAIGIPVVLIVGIGVWLLTAHNPSRSINNATPRTDSEKTATAKSSSPSINLSPPTDEEKAAGDNQKQEIVKQQESPPTPNNIANVVIVDANQYQDEVEVRAFVGNRIDTDGTCTITIAKGMTTVTRTKKATADATTTQCGSVDIPRSEFAEGGQWDVTVTYTSGGATGKANTSVTLQ